MHGRSMRNTHRAALAGGIELSWWGLQGVEIWRKERGQEDEETRTRTRQLRWWERDTQRATDLDAHAAGVHTITAKR